MTRSKRACVDRSSQCSAFTLTELLVAITIVTFLATMLVVALAGVQQDARAARTRSQIAKINQLLMFRIEEYRTRQIPIAISGASPLQPEPWSDTDSDSQWDPHEFLDQDPADGSTDYDWNVGGTRLYRLRQLMRMEMPDRMSDLMGTALVSPPSTHNPLGNNLRTPSLMRGYLRRIIIAGVAQPGSDGVWGTTSGGPMSNGDDDGDGFIDNITEWGWPGSDDRVANLAYQGAECLYMILASIQTEGGNGLEFFREVEKGDKDSDGLNEIHDAWGNPIEFIRWPAGRRAYPGANGVWGAAGDDDGDGTVNNATEAGWPGSDDRSIPTEIATIRPNDVRPAPITIHDLAAPDPFDVLRIDPRWADPYIPNDPFALFPLVYSAGRDEEYEIVSDRTDEPNVEMVKAAEIQIPPTAIQTNTLALRIGRVFPPNDPYHVPLDGMGNPLAQLGLSYDIDDDGYAGYLDNIDNHSGVSSD